MNLYLTSLSEVQKLPQKYPQTYFPKRFERSLRFLKEEDRLRCIGAGALLHQSLGIPEENIIEGICHKPKAANGRVFFNLSHSGKYVLLAVFDTEVGADIEEMDPAHLDLANEVYLPEEIAWMAEDPLPRFFRLWTLKESVMKECGLGFHLPPKSFSVLPLIRNGEMTQNGKRLFAASSEFDGHAVSVCAQKPFVFPAVTVLTAEDFRLSNPI